MPPRLLLTGFGPFPGVESNPTEELARAFAADCARHDAVVRAEVLPVDWTVWKQAAGLLDAFGPDIVLHFGVSVRATVLRVERSAFNRTLVRADCRGAPPPSRFVLAGGSDRLDTSLPVDALAADLRRRFHPARVSPSAGRYLCNFLYYQTLDWARRCGRDPLVGFIHVPPAAAMPPARLLDAAHEAVAFCLRVHAAARPARPAANPPLEAALT